MKKTKLLISILFLTLIFSACDKKNKNQVSDSEEKIEAESVSQNSSMPEKENENLPSAVDEKLENVSLIITPGKNGQPDEADIISYHKKNLENLENWFSKETSPDGQYYICYNSEYYYTYNRYCIPVEGERKDLNLIMLKVETEVLNPNDLGAINTDICNSGCEFIALARSSEPLLFKDETSYWFKVSEEKWLPGSEVYIQPGVFEKLPAEDLEIGLAYEKIENGLWLSVNTDDGSSLSLLDSSNKKTGKEILSLPQGSWIYADAQTISTETIDGLDSRWYRIVYPKKGYIFGGNLEKQDGVCGLEFAVFDISSYKHDDSKDYMFKVYSAPSVNSEFLGEYEILPGKYGYQSVIQTKQLETVDGVRGLWIYITEPVEGFIFGHNFIYK